MAVLSNLSEEIKNAMREKDSLKLESLRAIKSALINLTKYMAKYFKGSNIRFNSVSPGGIFNNQPDSFIKNYKSYCHDKGMLDPQDIDGAIIFLLSDSSKYINGQNIIIDDGFTL